MGFVALAVVVVGFAAGVFLIRRFAPPLADTREGRIVFWVVAVLVGASLGLVADAAWLAIRALTIQNDTVPGAFSSTESVVVSTARTLFFEASAPLALAAILHQLGPGVAEPEPRNI
jgi:hypothetical protein